MHTFTPHATRLEDPFISIDSSRQTTRWDKKLWYGCVCCRWVVALLLRSHLCFYFFVPVTRRLRPCLLAAG